MPAPRPFRSRSWRYAAGWLLALALCALGWPAGQASAAPVPAPGTDFTFAQLGFQNRLLRSSSDEARLALTLPATWSLTGQVTLRLHYAAQMVGPGQAGAIDPLVLRVRLNNQIVAYVPISQSISETLALPIDSALLANAADRPSRNTLSFTIDDSASCTESSPSELTIFADSALSLPHALRPVVTELTNYPFPLVENSIVPDAVALVVPQQPTAQELAAAFAAGASLRDIDSSLNLHLLSADQLGADQRAAEHLVLIGRPSRLPLLARATLPAPFTDDRFPSLKIADATGVVQLAQSPWNAQRALLLVSGASDAAVLKAAQGLEALRRGPRPVQSIALVADVRDTPADTLPFGRPSFAQLGMPASTMRGFGNNTAEYRFMLPVNQGVPANASLLLSFAHSALLNDARSSLTLLLNGQIVGNVRLSQATATGGLVTLRLPPTALQPGSNRLVFDATLRPLSACGKPAPEDIWLTIRDDSAFAITSDDDASARGLPFSLERYPAPFAFHPDLAQLGVVLPRGDAAAWNAAMRITIQLADSANGGIVAPAVAFADALPSALRAGHDLIVVGQPRDLPLLAELREQLPIVFAPASNTPDDRRSRVVLHFDPPERQGYLQIVRAPWNPERAVLAVLGRNAQELGWAAAGLTASSLRHKLSGQLAFVQGDTVVLPQLVAAPNDLLPKPLLAPVPGDQAVQLAPTAAAAPAEQPPASAPAQPPVRSYTLFGVLLLLAIGAGGLGLRAWVMQREIT